MKAIADQAPTGTPKVFAQSEVDSVSDPEVLEKMARTHSPGEKPWWFQVLQQLDSESDGEDVDYPSDSELWSDTESIDIEHTDDETQSLKAI